MLIHEFRVPLHMTVDEFQVAQLYMVLDASEKNTKNGEGVEILKNEPYDNSNGQLGDISPLSLVKIPRNKGQYTLKHYHVKSHIPSYVSAICPEESMVLIEEAWNAYPHCLTVITNGYLAKQKFYISIETVHAAGAGDEDNAVCLSPAELRQRTVEYIRIDSHLPNEAPTPQALEFDPSTYTCPKTGRGPLQAGWERKLTPVMTCYKVVRVNFDYWGFQGRVENAIRDRQRRLFHSSLRQAQCLSHKWNGLTMDDIRRLEANVQN
ncbi:hypothetical protein, variant [Aphanomyces invadans]|uniref:Phosphatidylinositol transfer protein N-terminal domain-containing protein n=1 Tax=Aphanomyces invadans TaxID=157072 RepID=A0A024UDG3_9STRA|nr:hypothetical protein, variant [Aphanomyces invadans]ETW04421.1 hypothetical protein, variant [Aphanomyces invadans]|eukprot:XP_008867377.1 hypothetical protein, variant [Aphanomyces invadans]